MLFTKLILKAIIKSTLIQAKCLSHEFKEIYEFLNSTKPIPIIVIFLPVGLTFSYLCEKNNYRKMLQFSC